MQPDSEIKNPTLNMQPCSCDPFKTLYIFLKIFSLQSDKERNQPKFVYYTICKCVLTSIVLISMSICSLCYKILYFYTDVNVSIKLTDAVQMVYDLCQYIVDVWFVYIYGRAMSVEYFRQYIRIDEMLHMSYSVEIKRRLNKMIIFFASTWMFSSVCDFIAWMLNFGLSAPFAYSLSYVYLLIKMLTTLDLITQVMHVEYRLRCIGDFIEGNYCMENRSNSFSDCCVYRDNLFYITNKITEKSCVNLCQTVKRASPSVDDEMKILSKYYLLLIEQTAFINKMYGMRILLNSLSLLIDMVRFTNITVRLIIGSQAVVSTLEYFPAFSSVMRLFTCVAVIISLVDHCEKAYRQRERVFNIIDHYIIMRDPSDTVRSAMLQFRDLVESRPVSFHMAHFFRFDYSLLVSIASVVVTYTIIILQSTN